MLPGVKKRKNYLIRHFQSRWIISRDSMSSNGKDALVSTGENFFIIIIKQ